MKSFFRIIFIVLDLLIVLNFTNIYSYAEEEKVLIITDKYHYQYPENIVTEFENDLKKINFTYFKLNIDILQLDKVNNEWLSNFDKYIVFSSEMNNQKVRVLNKLLMRKRIIIAGCVEQFATNNTNISVYPLPNNDKELLKTIFSIFPIYDNILILSDKNNLSTSIGKKFNNVLRSYQDTKEKMYINEITFPNLIKLLPNLNDNSFFIVTAIEPKKLLKKNNFDSLISISNSKKNIPIFTTNKFVFEKGGILACFIDAKKYSYELISLLIYNQNKGNSKAIEIQYRPELVKHFGGELIKVPKFAKMKLTHYKDDTFRKIKEYLIVVTFVSFLFILIYVIYRKTRKKITTKSDISVLLLSKSLNILKENQKPYDRMWAINRFLIEYLSMYRFYAYYKDHTLGCATIIEIEKNNQLNFKNTDIFYKNQELFENDIDGNEILIFNLMDAFDFDSNDNKYILLHNLKSLVTIPAKNKEINNLYVVFEYKIDKKFTQTEKDLLTLYANSYTQIIADMFLKVTYDDIIRKSDILCESNIAIYFSIDLNEQTINFEQSSKKINKDFEILDEIVNLKNLYNILTPHYKVALEKELNSINNRSIENIDIELCINSKKNDEQWFRLVGKISESDNSKKRNLLEGIISNITNQKLMHLSFMEIERKFKTLFEHSNSGMIIIENGKISDSNKRFYQILLMTKLQVIGKTLSELSPEMQSDNQYSVVKESRMFDRIFSEKKMKMDWEFINLKSQKVYTQMIFNIITLNQKQVIIGETTDLTEITLTQQKLINSEKRFRNLSETANSVIFITRSDFSIKYMNPFAEQIFEYSLEEVIGCNVLELLVPDIDEQGNELRKKVANEIKSLNYLSLSKNTQINLNRSKTGNLFWFSWSNSAVKDEYDNITEYYFIGNNITELKDKETQLKENEEQLKIMLNSIGDAVIAVNTKKQIILMNPIAEDLTGLSFAQCQNVSIDKVFHIVNSKTGDRQENPIDKVLESKTIVNLSNDTTLISHDGKQYNISDSAAPIISADGTLEGVILIFRDITFQYIARQQLIDSEARFRLFYEKINLASIYCKPIYDETGNLINYEYIDANISYINITGIKKENIIGNTAQELYTDIEGSWFEFIGSQLKENRNLTYEKFFKPTNKNYLCSVFKIYPGDENFWIVFIDVTDRANMVKALRESEEKYRYIMDYTNDRIMINFEDKRQPVVNKAFYEVAGYSWEDVYIHNLRIKTHPEDINLLEDAFTQAVINGHSNFQYRIYHKNGSLLYQSGVTAVVKNKMNEIIAFVTILRDITDVINFQEELKRTHEVLQEYNKNLEIIVADRTREISDKNIEIETALEDLKQTQSLLVQSEKMAALGKLISGITHEINSPLGSIYSSIESTSHSLTKTLTELPDYYLLLI